MDTRTHVFRHAHTLQQHPCSPTLRHPCCLCMTPPLPGPFVTSPSPDGQGSPQHHPHAHRSLLLSHLCPPRVPLRPCSSQGPAAACRPLPGHIQASIFLGFPPASHSHPLSYCDPLEGHCSPLCLCPPHRPCVHAHRILCVSALAWVPSTTPCKHMCVPICPLRSYPPGPRAHALSGQVHAWIYVYTCVQLSPLDPNSPWGGGGPGQLGLPLPQLRTQWGAIFADIDECLSNPCVNGACRNLAGSYACECVPGSRLGPSGTMCLGERAPSPTEWQGPCCPALHPALGKAGSLWASARVGAGGDTGDPLPCRQHQGHMLAEGPGWPL